MRWSRRDGGWWWSDREARRRDERPCGIQWRQLDRPRGLVVGRFIIDEPMPEATSMLAADLVHNTRSALDHILARLTEHLGGDPEPGLHDRWRVGG
jgi:hypothetical protein